jgi:hypothetical protein
MAPGTPDLLQGLLVQSPDLRLTPRTQRAASHKFGSTGSLLGLGLEAADLVCAWQEQRCRLSGTQKVSGIADKVKDTNYRTVCIERLYNTYV